MKVNAFVTFEFGTDFVIYDNFCKDLFEIRTFRRVVGT